MIVHTPRRSALILPVALALLATGCDEIESLCKTTCEWGATCQPSEFYDDFASMDECRNHCVAEAENTKNQVSADCWDAYVDFHDCFYHLSCSSVAGCEKEYNRYYTRCDGQDIE